jgi:predicted alpha-1,2-mannosidase
MWFRRSILGAFGLVFLLGACADDEAEQVRSGSAFVDPLIGTGGVGFGVGSIAPGPTLPFGLAKPSPDTSSGGEAPGFSHCGGYYFEDDEVRGFSQIHLSGTGVPDYGVLLVMPVVDGAVDRLREGDYRSDFDHRREQAEVGSYSVTLIDSRIEARIGATERTALYEFAYPSGANAGVVWNLDHGLGGGTTVDGSIDVDVPAKELSGWLHHNGDISVRSQGFRLYFVARWDRATTNAEVSEDGRRALLSFGAGSQEPVRMQIGLSFVDLEGARANLEAEWMGFDLEKAREHARSSWDQILSRIAVSGGSDKERKKFYTALYHTFQMPTLFTDVDRRYRGIDKELGTASDYTYYSDFSLWDTYRTVHPLLVLIAPEIQEDLNKSLVAMLDAGGHLPQWPLATGYTWTMIGHHGETMLIDAYLKGVGGFDVDRVFEHLDTAAMGVVEKNEQSRSGRDCVESYLALGYCPMDGTGGGATSETLENAYNDWVLANFADALGRTERADYYRQRSSNWTHLFNPETGLIQGRRADGSFDPEFREDLFSRDLVEGNARQWTVFVPQDVVGLAEQMGGKERLVAWLEDFFGNAAAAEDTLLPDLWYWHGNEPDIHAAYMFSELGRHDLTAKWVRWIMDARYDATPAGLDGNDDGGTLSAWYVFSALGLYPRTGSTTYVLGVPRFPEAVVSLGEGRSLRIVADGPVDGPVDVQSVELNGVTLGEPLVEHAALAEGGELIFRLVARE